MEVETVVGVVIGVGLGVVIGLLLGRLLWAKSDRGDTTDKILSIFKEHVSKALDALVHGNRTA